MKPAHKDACGHNRSEFVGTFFVSEKDGTTSTSGHDGMKGMARDLYVWTNRAGEQEVCIRCGEDPTDYYSPGRLSEWLGRCAHNDGFTLYAKAVQILIDTGKFKWEEKSDK